MSCRHVIKKELATGSLSGPQKPHQLQRTPLSMSSLMNIIKIDFLVNDNVWGGGGSVLLASERGKQVKKEIGSISMDEDEDTGQGQGHKSLLRNWHQGKDMSCCIGGQWEEAQESYSLDLNIAPVSY